MYTADQLRAMTGPELDDMIRTRSRGDLTMLLVFVHRYAPEAMAEALNFQEDPRAYVDRLLGDDGTTASVAS